MEVVGFRPKNVSAMSKLGCLGFLFYHRSRLVGQRPLGHWNVEVTCFVPLPDRRVPQLMRH